jgi:hypothetical protein
MQRVNDSHFVSSTKLDELTSQAENMFGARVPCRSYSHR